MQAPVKLLFQSEEEDQPPRRAALVCSCEYSPYLSLRRTSCCSTLCLGCTSQCSPRWECREEHQHLAVPTQGKDVHGRSSGVYSPSWTWWTVNTEVQRSKVRLASTWYWLMSWNSELERDCNSLCRLMTRASGISRIWAVRAEFWKLASPNFHSYYYPPSGVLGRNIAHPFGLGIFSGAPFSSPPWHHRP